MQTMQAVHQMTPWLKYCFYRLLAAKWKVYIGLYRCKWMVTPDECDGEWILKMVVRKLRETLPFAVGGARSGLRRHLCGRSLGHICSLTAVFIMWSNHLMPRIGRCNVMRKAWMFSLSTFLMTWPGSLTGTKIRTGPVKYAVVACCFQTLSSWPIMEFAIPRRR